MTIEEKALKYDELANYCGGEPRAEMTKRRAEAYVLADRLADSEFNREDWIRYAEAKSDMMSAHGPLFEATYGRKDSPFNYMKVLLVAAEVLAERCSELDPTYYHDTNFWVCTAQGEARRRLGQFDGQNHRVIEDR